MSKYVEFPLDDGGTILIESADEKKGSGSGFVKAGSAEETVDKAAHSFEQAVENIRQSSNALVSKLRSLSQPPDEMEVNFSLKASSEVGRLFVARGNTEAAYTVILRWHREEKRDEGKDEKKE
jgi:hypothetical protein